MMGHTDKATINERRPLSPGMRATLKQLAREPFNSDGFTDNATKNQLRALMDRGYAMPDNSGNPWRITEAGKAAVARVA